LGSSETGVTSAAIWKILEEFKDIFKELRNGLSPECCVDHLIDTVLSGVFRKKKHIPLGSTNGIYTLKMVYTGYSLHIYGKRSLR
jgi:hypothetical protein